MNIEILENVRALPPERRRLLSRMLSDGKTALMGGQIGRADRTRDSRLPLSFAQQRLWFLAQLEGLSATYNMPMAWRLRGQLDREALEKTFGEIVSRHEVLRTRFEEREGVPY